MRSSSADPSSAVPLYTARVDNLRGTSGHVRIHDGPAALATEGTGEVSLPTGPPRAPGEGLNPEQFLAMAWSTCLGETLRVVLREQGETVESRVSVEVELHRDPAGGYRFHPRALLHLPGIEAPRAQELAAAAHARCPVSRLLTGQGSAQLEVRTTM